MYQRLASGGLFGPEFRALMGGGAWWVSALAFGPQGDVLAEGRQDQVLELWDVRTGDRLWQRVLPDAPIALRFSPDGTEIAAFFYEAGVAIYGREPASPVRWVAPCFDMPCDMSSDGRWLLVSGEKVRERKTGRLVALLSQDLEPATATFSADGKALAIGGGGHLCAKLQLWDTSDWSVLADRSWPFDDGRGELGTTLGTVAWAPDGGRLALGGEAGAIYVSDSRASHLVRLGTHDSQVSYVLFTPDGRLVSAGGEPDTIKVWEVNGGRCLTTLSGHNAGITALAVSPDGSLVATGDVTGCVRLWDLATGRCRRVLGPSKADEDRLRRMERALDSEGEAAQVGFLNDEDPAVRAWAARSLINTRDVDAMKAVAAALRDLDVDVRLCAAKGLEGMSNPWGGEGPFISDISPAVEPLTECLKDPQVSCQAALAMRWAHDPRATHALIGVLGSPSLMTRWAATCALAEASHRDAVPALMQVVAREDEDAEVREYAAHALRTLGDRQATGALIQALGTTWSNVREAAAEALGELGGPAAVKALCGLLEDASERPGIRCAAARSLGTIGDRAAAPALMDALRDSSAVIRASAADALGEIRAAEAAEPLLRLLKADPDDGVRQAAAEALGEIGDARAVAPLIVRFERGSPLARDTAARALAQIGDPRGIDVLLSALKSPDWGVRMHVASALRGVDEPRVVTALIDLLLHDPEGNVRSEAATALGESKDPRVVPALTQALEDESAQWSAEEALESLREQKPGHGLTPH